MSSRKEYFQKYYQEHKAEIIKRSQEDYEKNKRKRLTYAQKYYILNKDKILAKLKTKSLAFTGHAHAIWNAIRKYAKEAHTRLTWLFFWQGNNKGFFCILFTNLQDRPEPIVNERLSVHGAPTQRTRYPDATRGFRNTTGIKAGEHSKKLRSITKKEEKSDKKFTRILQRVWSCGRACHPSCGAGAGCCHHFLDPAGLVAEICGTSSFREHLQQSGCISPIPWS